MCAEKQKIPFKQGMWVIRPSGEARLLGSRCLACGEVLFPQRSHGYCVHCQQRKLQSIELSPTGKIANFTMVMQPPAGGYYHGPTPYCFGLVVLDDGVRIETHLGGDAKQLSVGMKVRLAIKTLYKDEAGNEVQIYSFQPEHTKDRSTV